MHSISRLKRLLVFRERELDTPPRLPSEETGNTQNGKVGYLGSEDMSTTYLTRVKISFLSLFFIQHTFVLASNSPHGDRYIDFKPCPSTDGGHF